jgi:hypothetical protein
LNNSDVKREALFIGTALVGYLIPDGPTTNPTNWCFNKFEPTQQFEDYRSLFDLKREIWDEYEKNPKDPTVMNRLKEVLKNIDDLDIRIRSCDGETVGLTAIDIQDDRANYRFGAIRSVQDE